MDALRTWERLSADLNRWEAALKEAQERVDHLKREELLAFRAVPEDYRPAGWATLPTDLVCAVLTKYVSIQTFRDAFSNVCTAWRRACETSLTLRKTSMVHSGRDPVCPSRIVCGRKVFGDTILDVATATRVVCLKDHTICLTPDPDMAAVYTKHAIRWIRLRDGKKLAALSLCPDDEIDQVVSSAQPGMALVVMQVQNIRKSFVTTPSSRKYIFDSEFNARNYRDWDDNLKAVDGTYCIKTSQYVLRIYGDVWTIGLDGSLHKKISLKSSDVYGTWKTQIHNNEIHFHNITTGVTATCVFPSIMMRCECSAFTMSYNAQYVGCKWFWNGRRDLLHVVVVRVCDDTCRSFELHSNFDSEVDLYVENNGTVRVIEWVHYQWYPLQRGTSVRTMAVRFEDMRAENFT